MNEIQMTTCEKVAAGLPELGSKEQPAWLSKTTVSEKLLPEHCFQLQNWEKAVSVKTRIPVPT